jgi:putative membrane protein
MALQSTFTIALCTGLLAGSAFADSAADAPFFAIYDQVNQADIEIAQLGAIKGYSEDVRRIAATILRDHAAVQQMARDIAADNSVSFEGIVDDSLASSHAATLEKLSALEGPAFDEAYLQHEVPFHRNASLAVRDQLVPAVQTEEFKTHLETVLPHFEHHLRLTLDAAEKLGVPVE